MRVSEAGTDCSTAACCQELTQDRRADALMPSSTNCCRLSMGRTADRPRGEEPRSGLLWAALGRPGQEVKGWINLELSGLREVCGLQDATMGPCQEHRVNFHRLSLAWTMVPVQLRERDLAPAFSDPFQTPSEPGRQIRHSRNQSGCRSVTPLTGMTRRLKATSRFVLNLILSITSNMTVFCDSGLATAREPRATESSTPRAEALPREHWLLYWLRYLRQGRYCRVTAQHSRTGRNSSEQ